MLVMFKDEEILDIGFRLKMIKQINSAANKQRKADSEVRYQLFKDKTRPLLKKSLQAQGFLADTIKQMMARAANISIFKKIIKKKARAYVAGVERTIRKPDGSVDDAATKDIQAISDLMSVSQVFRKGDEFREMSKNAMIYCHPLAVANDSVDPTLKVWSLTTRVLMAHQFDAIPDGQNREISRCIVLSDYEGGLQEISQDRGVDGYRDADGSGSNATLPRADTQRYVWWTALYHFTTDGNGEILGAFGRPDSKNLIGSLPFVGLFKDQDGEFWAEGGDDLVEGSILVNLLLTDTAGVLSAQGWGQPVLTEQQRSDGKKPEEVTTGPHNLIRLAIDENGNAGSYELVSTDTKTESWLKLVEVYVALMLTTNNLSPRNISGKLDAASVASGIAKMIDEAESTEDITDSQSYFQKREQEFWVIVSKWLEVLRPTERLVEKLKVIKPFDGDKVTTSYKMQGVVLSETERADLIKKKKEIGLTKFIELIKMEKPGFSDDEAKKYLMEVIAERLMIIEQDPTLLAAESSTATIVAEQPGMDPNQDPAAPAAKPPVKTKAPPKKNKLKGEEQSK